jgi:hypothetical protein
MLQYLWGDADATARKRARKGDGHRTKRILKPGFDPKPTIKFSPPGEATAGNRKIVERSLQREQVRK